MRSISSKRHTFIKNLPQSQASLGCSWSRYDLARHRGVANGTQAHSLQTWNFECKSQTNWMTKNQKRETLNLWFLFRINKMVTFHCGSCPGYNRQLPWPFVSRKSWWAIVKSTPSWLKRMLLQSTVFPVNDHWKKQNAIVWKCTKQFQVHTSCIATTPCSQWLEPPELFPCGSRHFTISSHQTRPKAMILRISPLYNIKPPDKAKGHPSDFLFGSLLCRPVQATASFDAGHLSNPWKKLINKPSLWINYSKSPSWIIRSFWVNCIPTK